MPRLIGKRIILREYEREDFKYMRRWVNDPEITNYLTDLFLYPHTIVDTENFLDFMLDNKSSTTKGFVIAHRDSGEYIGQIDLMTIDWINRVSKIGIVIGVKDNFGKGYGTEAIQLLQEFAFNKLNLHKLELEVREFNKRAIRTYEKCGFKKEGRIRENFYIGGHYKDTIHMGVLKREWQEMNNIKNSG